MGRLGHGFNHLEAPAVLQRRHAASRLGDLGRIDLGEDHAGLGAAFGHDASPGVDHQRMAIGLAAVLMHTALRGLEGDPNAAQLARAERQRAIALAGVLQFMGLQRQGGQPADGGHRRQEVQPGQPGHHGHAQLAARVGRTVDPASEAMWRDAITAEAAAGNREEVSRLVEQLYTWLEEFEEGLEPEDETVELIDTLREHGYRVVA